MVSRTYMLEKPPGPAAWKQFLDLSVVPAAIDGLAAVESAFEWISVQGRARPMTVIGFAFGFGAAASWPISRRQR